MDFLSSDLNTKEIPLGRLISASCLVAGCPLGIITCDYFQAATFIPQSTAPAFSSSWHSKLGFLPWRAGKGGWKGSRAHTRASHPWEAQLSSRPSIPKGLWLICLGPKTHNSRATVTVRKFSLQIGPVLKINLHQVTNVCVCSGSSGERATSLFVFFLFLKAKQLISPGLGQPPISHSALFPWVIFSTLISSSATCKIWCPPNVSWAPGQIYETYKRVSGLST